MLRRVGVMITVRLADSLNPRTAGPALYLATAHQVLWRVSQFTVGVLGTRRQLVRIRSVSGYR